jgi:polysaccharide biosynthesis/export protein
MATSQSWWSILALLFVGALVSCASSPANSSAPIDPAVDQTALGPGDLFEVRVFGDKDLSGIYQVATDGTISFPFLGRVTVVDKEPTRVAVELADGLRDGGYLRDPHVTLLVTQANSKRISVLGAVAKPGTLPIIAGITIVQAVSQAGGFTPLASKDDTVVTRRLGGKLQRYRITVSEITRGNADDFVLRPGDIVFVPERVF